MGDTLCLSDLHLGESYGLLRGDRAEWAGRELRAAAGIPPRLILPGDIWEGAIPESGEAIRSASWGLFSGLVAREPLDEVIWIPGNHDHLVLQGGEELVRQLIGPAGDRIKKVTVAPAVYFDRIGGREVMFTHGHLLDGLFRGATATDRAQQVVVSVFAGYFPTPGDLTGVKTLEEWELRAGAWVDACFGTPAKSRTRLEGWESLCRFDNGRCCPEARDDTGRGMVGTAHEEPGAPPLEPLDWLLRLTGRDKPDMMVYGHTHAGGQSTAAGIEVHNCGGWVTGWDAAIPCTHGVLVDERGRATDFVLRFPWDWIEECRDHGVREIGIPVGG